MTFFRNKHVRQLLGVLETCNLLMLKLALRQPRGNLRTFPALIFRDYMRLASVDRWRCVELHTLLGDSRNIRPVIDYRHGNGINIELKELAVLASLTQIVRPKRVFEIGTFRGLSTLHFALNSDEDCRIFTLDLAPENRAAAFEETNLADRAVILACQTGAEFRNDPLSRKITQLYGNSISFDYSPYAGSMDLVFVDGAHHYDAVLADTKNGLKMLRPGGMLVWHDFANYGDYNDVTRAIFDVLPEDSVLQIEDTQLAVFRSPVRTEEFHHEVGRASVGS
jgi:predicted O-methyltransferase YrrM